MGCHFKSTSGTGTGLLKDQGNVLAVEFIMRDAGLFLGLEVRGQIKQLLDLRRGVIQKLEKAAILEAHCIFPSLYTNL